MQTLIEYAPPVEVSSAILSRREQIANIEADIEKLKNYANFVALIKHALPPDAEILIGTYGTPSIDIMLMVNGFLTDVAPGLYELLEFISTFYAKSPSSFDYPQDSQRVYRFYPEDALTPGIRITATLVEGTEFCRRIVTGTHKVERLVPVQVVEPIYTFKC